MNFNAVTFLVLGYTLAACTANAAGSPAPDTHNYLTATECSLNGQGCKNVFYLLPDEYVNRHMDSLLQSDRQISPTTPDDVRSIACGSASALLKSYFGAPTVQADETVWQLTDVNCLPSVQAPRGALPLPANMLAALEQPGPYTQQNNASQ